MKVALLYPYRKKNVTGCNPPLSLLYLGAALLEAGHEVCILDRDEADLTVDDFVARMREFGPGLIGLPVFSNSMGPASQLITSLASGSPSWTIAVGGPHPTARPRKTLTTFPACRFALRGESENSIVALVEHLDGKRALSTVPGLAYRQGSDIVLTEEGPHNQPLDSLPLPARSLLDRAYASNTYWRVGHRGTTDIMITSRGCPFDCHFCFKVTSTIRSRSPENILSELIAIRNMGTRSVHIMDDLFTTNKSRCIKILKLIQREKLGMEFKVRARVDRIDRELLMEMKAAGVRSVVYGIESGSQEMLDRMNKKSSVEQNVRAVEMTKRMGLQCYADMFIGYPGETPETIGATEDFLLKTRPTAVNLAVMYPLPHTRVYEEARNEGSLEGDWGTHGIAPWIRLPWTKNRRDLDDCRMRILRRFTFHPLVMWNAVRALVPGIDFRQLRILAGYAFRVLFGLKNV